MRFSTQSRAIKLATLRDGVAPLAGCHSLPGERPVRLLRVLARMRAATLFCHLRPGRACRQNSPARTSGKAGPPYFVAFRDASVRSFVPSSAAHRPNQGGPVSPDVRAAFAFRMLRTLSPPWTGCERADRKICLGANVSLPPAWARVTSVRIAVYRVAIGASAHHNAIGQPPSGSGRSRQRLLGVAGSRRVARSRQRLLGVAGALGTCSLLGAKAGCALLRQLRRFSAVACFAVAQPLAGSARSLRPEALQLPPGGSPCIEPEHGTPSGVLARLASGRTKTSSGERAIRHRPAVGGLASLALAAAGFPLLAIRALRLLSFANARPLPGMARAHPLRAGLENYVWSK